MRRQPQSHHPGQPGCCRNQGLSRRAKPATSVSLPTKHGLCLRDLMQVPCYDTKQGLTFPAACWCRSAWPERCRWRRASWLGWTGPAAFCGGGKERMVRAGMDQTADCQALKTSPLRPPQKHAKHRFSLKKANEIGCLSLLCDPWR